MRFYRTYKLAVRAQYRVIAKANRLGIPVVCTPQRYAGIGWYLSTTIS